MYIQNGWPVFFFNLFGLTLKFERPACGPASFEFGFVFGKACCYFALASAGSTFVLASFGCLTLWLSTTCMAVRTSREYRVVVLGGVKQGCVLTLRLFCSVLEWALSKWKVRVRTEGIDLEDGGEHLLDLITTQAQPGLRSEVWGSHADKCENRCEKNTATLYKTSQNRPPLPSIAPRLQPCLSNHTNVLFVQTVRICLPNALLDVQQVLFQTVAIAAFGEPIVHGSDSWCSKQISNVDKRNFPPMFLCDMPQPFLARVDSRCAKFRATDPSNKSSLEFQPRIGSYLESGYRVWPYRHYECTGAELQNKRLVSQAQPPKTITTPRGVSVAVVDRDGCHKWLGCILSGNNKGSHRPDLEHHLQAASRALFANRNILCNKAVSLRKRLRFFSKIVTPVACFAAGHRKIYKTDLDTMDVHFRRLLRSAVGPPPPPNIWHEILHDWNARVARYVQEAGVLTWSHRNLQQY